MAPSPEEAIAFLHLIMNVVRRRRAKRGENDYGCAHGWHSLTKSVYHRLLQELRLKDQETMGKCIQLDKHEYHELLHLVTPLIMKEDTKMRKAVIPFSCKDKYNALNLKVVCKQTHMARH